MRTIALQIIFILIALAEWIFMESTAVFRGYVAEGWEMPVGMESARYVAVFGILFAFYISGRLIYRRRRDIFLVKLLASIWLSVELYKLQKERQTDQQKMPSSQEAGNRLFCICLVGVFSLMWTNPFF